MNDREEIIKALTILKKLCDSQSECSTCPLSDMNHECSIYDMVIGDYKINEPDKTIWKAWKEVN